jgi:cytoskeletal protein RodZ
MSKVDQAHVDGSSEPSASKTRRRFSAFFKRKTQSQQDEQAGDSDTSPRSFTSKVGQLLWETRQEKQLTLEQAEAVTRIRAKYLEALENGEYEKLPTQGHVFGFLRSYAIYLGLDWEEVSSLHMQERPSRHFDPGIFHPENIVLSPRRFSFKIDFVLGLVIVLIIVVVGAWAFWEYGRSLLYPSLFPTATFVPATATPKSVVAGTATRVLATATRVPKTVTAQPTQTTMATATATRPAPTPTATATLNAPLPIATPTPLPTETPTPTPTRSEGVTLVIEIVERAWLQVTIDGQDQPSGILEAGETREWQATNTIYLICGNAGGVNVTVNGEDLGLLGERAQVVEKMWAPQGEVTPTPEAQEAEPGSGTATPTTEPTPTPSS